MVSFLEDLPPPSGDRAILSDYFERSPKMLSYRYSLLLFIFQGGATTTSNDQFRIHDDALGGHHPVLDQVDQNFYRS